MIERTSGSIVAFSSSAVRSPMPGLGAYVSSKFGVEGLVQVLALEVGENSIRVNAMHPGGMTDTGLFPEWVTDEMRSKMHRPGVVRALAAYLASDESQGVTGARSSHATGTESAASCCARASSVRLLSSVRRQEAAHRRATRPRCPRATLAQPWDVLGLAPRVDQKRRKLPVVAAFARTARRSFHPEDEVRPVIDVVLKDREERPDARPSPPSG